MTDIKTDIKTITLSLKGIDTLSVSLETEVFKQFPEALERFSFSTRIDTELEPDKKFAFVIVTVSITTEDQKHKLGQISVVTHFQVDNFSELITIGEDKKVDIDKHLLNMFNTISFSTTRGVMYGIFKGTALHRAILPILDPTTLKREA